MYDKIRKRLIFVSISNDIRYSVGGFVWLLHPGLFSAIIVFGSLSAISKISTRRGTVNQKPKG